MSDVQLIHLSSKITLYFRIAILISIVLLTKLGGYLPIDAKLLYLSIAPLSIFFITAFLRFALKYPYPIPDNQAKMSSLFVVSPLLIAYLTLIMLIVLSALKPDVLSFESLHIVVVLMECFFAIHAALSLPQIFKRFPL